MNRNILLGVGAAVALAFSAPAAFAGDAACVWRNLPDAKKVAPFKAAETDPVEATDQISFNDEDVGKALDACHVKPENRGAIARAAGRLSGAVLAEQWFRAARGITAEQLDKAWTSLSAADRDVVKRRYDGVNDDDAYRRICAAFVAKLGLPASALDDDALFRAVVSYTGGRAGAEALEEKL